LIGAVKTFPSTLDERNALIQALSCGPYQGVPDDIIDAILSYCMASGLNPFSRPVEARRVLDGRHGVARWALSPCQPLHDKPPGVGP